MTKVKYFGWSIPTVIGAVIAISTPIDPWLIGAAVAVVILAAYSGAAVVTQRGMTRAKTKTQRRPHQGHVRSGR